MKNKKLKIISLIVSIIAIVALATYAWIIWNSPNNTELTMQIGTLAEVSFKTGNDISASNMGPVLNPEADGEITTFSVKNNATYDYAIDININITAIDNALKDESFKYMILSSTTENGTYTNASSGTFKDMVVGNNVAGGATIPAKSRVYFKFILYIDGSMENNTNMMNKSITGTLNVTAHENTPNSPDLVQGLIPITYDDANSTWVKADSTNTNNSWYDYSNKKWANAVLVKETAYSENISETNKAVSIDNTASSYNPTYTSSNQGVKSSSSINTFTFTTGNSTGTLSFDYTVSSESGWDKLTIKLDNAILVNAISGTQSSSYSGSLAANTTYTLTATYTKDSSQDKNDDEATISNIQVSNLSGSITIGSSGDYPWTESTITPYPINTYTSYQLGEDGNYNLAERNNVQASDTVGKYICSDNISTTCTTMYKITGYSSNIINKVDVYTVSSTPIRSSYVNAQVGTTIPESDVLAYYVWIPRYKYKVFNINQVENTDSYNAQTTGIDIIFENERASTGTIKCTNYSFAAPSEDTTNETCSGSNGYYYTHPAFTFGNHEVRGIWVGKFEISSENPSATNGGGNDTNLTVRVKPNVVSWRGNLLTNFYKVIYDMQTTNNIYGLSTNRSNTDSHMLKNIEWGAVAYLTNSKYGRCSNNTCTEVTINNSSTYITGNAGNIVSAASASGITNAYNTAAGQLASTTGNIYGVYDMSGGAYEYVMGNMSSGVGSYTYYASYGGSNYTYTGNEKYLDTYAYGSTQIGQTAYNRSRLGDATGETKSWYSDEGRIVNSTYSWFLRGGYYGDERHIANGIITSPTGTFSFYFDLGNATSVTSARSTLLLGGLQ